MRLNHVPCVLAAMCGLCASALTVTEWNNTKLNDIAVKDGNGAIVVLGTEGSWNDTGSTKEKVFDSDTATFFDPPNEASHGGPCWAGIELEEPRIVTRIRYFGRAANIVRMYGCVFQGANEADFSDAVVLHVATEADGWDGTNWGDVHVASEASMTPFKYLRVVSLNYTLENERGGYAGNAGEVEFYGVTEAKMRDKWGAKTAEFNSTYLISTFLINNHFSFGVGASSRVPFYEVQRKRHDADDSEYRDCGTIPFAFDGYTANTDRGYLFRDPEPVYETTDYRVRAYNPFNGASPWFTIGTFTPENVAQGTWIGPTGSWSNDNSPATNGEKAYDGDPATFVDLPGAKNKGGWTGLDLGAPVLVKGARAVARVGWTSRLNGSMVQVATELMPDPSGKSQYEFVDPVTVGIFTDTTEKSVAEIVFDEPVLARYVRIKAPDDATFNTAEFEVDLTPVPQFAPVFTVAMSDLENEYAVVSWNHLDANMYRGTSTVVFRANGPQGPWTELASLDVDTSSYTDDTLVVGPRYYYGVAFRRTIDGVDHTGPMSVRAYRRGRRLDRNPADETTLLAGITAFSNGTVWNNSGNDASKLFDGDATTFADMNENDVFIGLDMGTPVGFTAVAALPRAGYTFRLNATVVYGSNDYPSWDNVAPISDALVCTSDEDWCIAATTSDAECRYVVLGKPEKANFNCNVAELQFYGWTSAEAMSVLTGPTHVTLTKGNRAITIAWEACGQAVSYTIRRKMDNDAWETIASDITGTSYTDANIPFNGTRYSYQVVAVGTDATANSDEFSILPYTTGDGTGLWGVYTKNFTHGYDPAEEVALERIDPTIDFDWGANAPSEAVGADHFRITWTGLIIIPFDGKYSFRINYDDGARLMIDNAIVLNNWSVGGVFESRASVSLTAGVHPIRIDAQEQVGDARCQLFWGGCVDEEIVPASQLIPDKVAVDTVPKPWLGTRTFGGQHLGLTIFNADGSITLSSGGHDTWGDNEGFRYLWQKVKGDFNCSMKIDFTRVPPQSEGARGAIMLRNALSQGEPMFLALADARRRWNVKMRAGSATDGAAIQDSYDWDESAADICWMQITRRRSTFVVSVKTDATEKWRELYVYEDADKVFDKELFIGPASCSGSERILTQVTIDNFNLTPISEGSVIFMR